MGAESAIRDALGSFPDSSLLDIMVVSAADAVTMGEAPVAALRHKRHASIRVAAEVVARGEAAALYSAGHTGATVLAARRVLGLLAGVQRPALAATVPTKTGRTILLDVGANADCRPRHLVAFAVMGAVFARVGLDTERPRVGLLSIGEEAGKGNALVRAAYRLLSDSALPFIGNVEARDLYGGVADVIVCDGFTGNVALKVSESMVEMMGATDALRSRVDHAEYGGAPLLGVGGPCVVGHGRSSARAVRNAILLAHRFAADGLVPRIEEGLRGVRGYES